MLKEIIEKIKQTNYCKVYPPKGVPTIDNYELPDDVKEFYLLCGGIVLYENSYFPFEIVPPNKFIHSNIAILEESFKDDISNDWFIIAQSPKTNDFFISIDLNKDRKGLYYDSFYERYGLIGEMPIIATSLEQLLENLLLSQGNNIYWESENFVSIGDAYEGIKESLS